MHVRQACGSATVYTRSATVYTPAVRASTTDTAHQPAQAHKPTAVVAVHESAHTQEGATRACPTAAPRRSRHNMRTRGQKPVCADAQSLNSTQPHWDALGQPRTPNRWHVEGDAVSTAQLAHTHTTDCVFTACRRESTQGPGCCSGGRSCCSQGAALRQASGIGSPAHVSGACSCAAIAPSWRGA